MQTARAILTPVGLGDDTKCKTTKISIVGCGQVGMACALAILSKKICAEICLIDLDGNRARGEALDLTHGCTFIEGCPRITSSSDYSCAENSNIIVVTAGVRTMENETRLDLVQRNAEVFKAIIPPLAKSSPNSIFVIVSNPCDVLAYVTMKLSNFPPNRIIGSGCNLDTARFRCLVAERLGIPQNSINGLVIGEHGDSLVPVWSSLNVGGVRLTELNPDIGTEEDAERWIDIKTRLVKSAAEIKRLKTYTNWGIGLSVGNICSMIMWDSREIIPVSTYVKSCKQGVDKDVYISLPVVLGATGVMYIVKQTLSESEKKALQESANNLYEVQKTVKLD